MGKHVNICPHCFIGNRNLVIGNYTSVNYDVWFDISNRTKIEIGSNCNISYRVTFITSTHEIGKTNRRAAELISSDIQVGNGCWIGAGVTILPGVKIGDGVIVAAGAVVVKDCEENGLYAGVPAKLIRKLSVDS